MMSNLRRLKRANDAKFYFYPEAPTGCPYRPQGYPRMGPPEMTSEGPQTSFSAFWIVVGLTP